jgi:hypothetical protein
VQGRREEWRRSRISALTHRRTKEAMKASGLPDLKARRKAHMPPTKGHPISPGGSRARRSAPSAASLYHPCALRAAASTTTKATAPTSTASAASLYHQCALLAAASASTNATAPSSTAAAIPTPSIPADRGGMDGNGTKDDAVVRAFARAGERRRGNRQPAALHATPPVYI